MANNVEKFSKYINVLDEVYKLASVTSVLDGNNRLVKMGANIVTRDRMAIVTGVKKIYGAEVNCSDLRAGAALTIAGMAAEGETILNDVHNIDRGYENLEEVFCSLGAKIKRIKNK